MTIKEIINDEGRLDRLKQHLKGYRVALHAKQKAIDAYKSEAVRQAVEGLKIDPALYTALVKANLAEQGTPGAAERIMQKALAKTEALAFYNDHPLFERLEGELE